MVELYEVAVFAKKVELELFLECEYGEQVVETVYLVAAENKLMELEQVVAVFVNVHLEVFTPSDPVFPIFVKLAVPFEEFNSDDLESNLEKNLVK